MNNHEIMSIAIKVLKFTIILAILYKSYHPNAYSKREFIYFRLYSSYHTQRRHFVMLLRITLGKFIFTCVIICALIFLTNLKLYYEKWSHWCENLAEG